VRARASTALRAVKVLALDSPETRSEDIDKTMRRSEQRGRWQPYEARGPACNANTKMMEGEGVDSLMRCDEKRGLGSLTTGHEVQRARVPTDP